MVTIGGTTRSRDDFEGVENVGDESIRFRNEVVGSLHVSTETTGTNESANEESAVGRVTLGGSVVDVDLTVLSGTGFEVEVGETSEFELESEGRFDVANSFEFLPGSILFAEGVVRRVLTFAANEKGESTHTVTIEFVRGSVDVLGETSSELLLIDRVDARRNGEGDVEDVPLFLRRSRGSVNLAL